MAQNMFEITLETLAVSVLLFLSSVACSHHNERIPSDRHRLNAWFNHHVKPRRLSIFPALAAAEAESTIIKVNSSAAGDGNFETISEAVGSIPFENKKRVVIHIAPGNYAEKITIDSSKPFVTLYGDPNDRPTLVFDGTAEEYGTVDSATLIVKSDYFSAVNLKIVNLSPVPDGVRKDAQAVALTIAGNYASFYNCSFYGYQDTLCDSLGKHVFKDCYIEGTVDFIFGSGQSLYITSEIHVISREPSDESPGVITAHARKTDFETSGFVFAHCKVTGSSTAYLGRIWFPKGRAVYAYSELSNVVHPEGWSDNHKTDDQRTVYFGECNNTGSSARFGERVAFARNLSDADAHQFLSLAFVEASYWLLPPAELY